MAHRVSRSERPRGVSGVVATSATAGLAAANLAGAIRRSVATMSPKRAALVAAGVMAAFVAAVGLFSPAQVAGTGPGASVAPTPAPSAAASAAATAAPSIVGTDWGGTGGIDVVDLIIKGSVVLILLFISLRVLGRMQSASPSKSGRLNVLESRQLASKASLHLVAVGDRRLVVGLTPNGMVALTELDAAELEAAEAAGAEASREGDAEAGPYGAAPRTTTPRPQLPVGQLPFASTLNMLLAPIDGFADKLAGKLGGSRVR
jgi:flagellar biogenesis protein FliO